METVIAMYDDGEDAREAIERLIEANFEKGDISLIASQAEEERPYDMGEFTPEQPDTLAGEGAVKGATVGGALGLLGGLLVGAGTIAFPGLGAIVLAGPLATMITGTAAGAASGGLIGGLVGHGIPEADAHMYAEGVRRGGTIVAAEVPEPRVEEAKKIMGQHGPVNVEERAEYWSEQGWDGRFESEESEQRSTV